MNDLQNLNKCKNRYDNKTAMNIFQSSHWLYFENDLSAHHLHYSGIVYPEKLVRGCYHIHSVRLAFAAFLVKKLIYRLVYGMLLKIYCHDLKQSLAKKWGTAFGDTSRLGIVLA